MKQSSPLPSGLPAAAAELTLPARRALLRGLLVLPLQNFLPVDALASIRVAGITGGSTPEQAQQQWQAALASPYWFDVDDGTLTVAHHDTPATRAELYELPPDLASSPQVLLRHASGCLALEAWLDAQWCDAEEAGDASVPPSWPAWVAALSVTQWRTLRRQVEEWAQDALDSEDWDYAGLYGCTGQSAALRFFQNLDASLCRALGIRIVEGEHPGSTYYAAELRVSCPDANRRAHELGLPVRFRPLGAAAAEEWQPPGRQEISRPDGSQEGSA